MRGNFTQLYVHCVWATWDCLVGSFAVETAAIQTKPAFAGFKILGFSSVRAGGLRFCSREFHSPDFGYSAKAGEAKPLGKSVASRIGG